MRQSIMDDRKEELSGDSIRHFIVTSEEDNDDGDEDSSNDDED